MSRRLRIVRFGCGLLIGLVAVTAILWGLYEQSERSQAAAAARAQANTKGRSSLRFFLAITLQPSDKFPSANNLDDSMQQWLDRLADRVAGNAELAQVARHFQSNAREYLDRKKTENIRISVAPTAIGRSLSSWGDPEFKKLPRVLLQEEGNRETLDILDGQMLLEMVEERDAWLPVFRQDDTGEGRT